MKKIYDFPAYPVRLRVAALIEREGSVLLVFDPVYRGGCWILPGGGAELDETVNQAVQREVLEETGLTVEAKEICTIREIWEPENDFPESQKIRKSFEIIFSCKYISGGIDIQHNSSVKRDGIARVKDCRWISANQIPDTIDGFPLYPFEFFQLYRSNKIIRIPWQNIFLPPLDLR
ncbi:MAG: NUDIX domain-containing protein [Anaerolineaceae bacterium]|nr:NUDIX domain-containing protein [Anaerolineaceae bacterium]